MIITTHVARWLHALPDDETITIIDTVSQVASDLDTPSPQCRKLAPGLWEARLTLSHRRQARMMFGFRNGEPVMLSGLVKKDTKRHTLEIVWVRRDLEATA